MSMTAAKNTEPFRVLHEDASVVVLDKAAGIAVLPERWERGAPNLVEAVQARWPGATAVHRIDKETSGLVLFARTSEAARFLQMEFEARRVGKDYHALLNGRPSWESQDCTAPLLIDADRHHRSVAVPGGHPDAKAAESRFELLARYRGCVLAAVRIRTGRTHQIRAHAAVLGHPIVGDHLYGGPKELRLSDFKPGWRGDRHEEQPLVARVALHARTLRFTHPGDGRALEFCADYPRDLRAALNQLERWS